MATSGDFVTLITLCDEIAEAAKWRDRLRSSAERLLDQRPLEYEIPDGKRLLRVSRAVKDRVLLLALMYQLTNEKHLADRAWIELDAVTAFKDWNPSHFLDTAEMTFAVAIGYDWLHDAWTEQQRQQLRKAIVALGLNEGLKGYRKREWWTRSIHNWNQVCNGGMGVGALAIADDEPELSAEVLHSALHALPLAMHEFRPDGGWGEGPGYWKYATEYNVYFLAALQTALGNDFGLSRMPGFPVTGDFPIHFTSPAGLTFNYADAHDSWRGAPQLFWLARAFDQPVYAAVQKRFANDRLSPLDFLWGVDWLDRDVERAAASQPSARYFAGVSVVTMRSAWNDPAAAFVGFKGGDNCVNHGQLDLGSFVFDSDGVRWAIDLGPDDYNIPGYFGRQRWSYYRNRTEGHNTLVINGQNQSTTATASIVRFGPDSNSATAVADLSNAYPDANRVERTMTLAGRTATIRDEIEADEAVGVDWHMHTEAAVTLDGQNATLTADGRTLSVAILEPSSAQFTVALATTEPPQRPLKNVRRLTITLPKRAGKRRIVVKLVPRSPLEE